MTLYLGEDTASKIGKAHESGIPDDISPTGLDMRIDKHNNNIGIAIGLCLKINLELNPGWTEKDIQNYIIKTINKDIQNGDLIWYLYDKRILNPKAPPYPPTPSVLPIDYKKVYLQPMAE
jgi:hypothetical protein